MAKDKAKHRKVKRLELAQRRLKVSELYLKGVPQARIAIELDTTTQVISQDINYLVTEWKALALTHIDDKKQVEIERINKLESMAHEAWEKSKKFPTQTKRKVERTPRYPPRPSEQNGRRPAERPPTMNISRISEESNESEDNPGDPRFLSQIERCIELRLKLMGAFDNLNNMTNNQFFVNWADLFKVREQAAAGKLEFPTIVSDKPVPVLTLSSPNQSNQLNQQSQFNPKLNGVVVLSDEEVSDLNNKLGDEDIYDEEFK